MGILQHHLARVSAGVVLFCSIIYFPLFLHLENLPIRLFDESRLAINAYEMMQNGKYVVTHFEGKPDMWNTKPPLMIWMQVAAMKLFGAGELAVRLPAALAALLTCILIFFFAAKYLGSPPLGWIAVLVLITTNGFVDVHVARTGDYDALLVLFTTFYCFSFFIYAETRNARWLLASMLGITGAVMTKGVAGLLFTPALAFYALFTGNVLSALKEKRFYAGIAVFIAVTGGYYLLREQMNPGYLQAVAENELGGRYLNTLEGHLHPYWMYYHSLVDFQFTPWHLLIPGGMLAGFFTTEKRLRNCILFSTVAAVSFFFIISSAKTRIKWYDAPMYPFLSLIVALPMLYVYEYIREVPVFLRRMHANVMPAIMLFIIFVNPYFIIMDKVYLPEEDNEVASMNGMSEYLQKMMQGRFMAEGSLVCFDGYKAPAIFYVNVMRQRGTNISFADWHYLEPGNKVLASQPEVKAGIESKYCVSILHAHEGVRLYEITGI